MGTENEAQITGREDGYFLNEAIRILMPKTLRNLEKPLRLGSGFNIRRCRLNDLLKEVFGQ